MSVESFLVHDVIVVEPSTRTDRTDTILDYATTTRTSERWWMAQQTSTDIRDTRTGQVTTWLATAPAESAVTAKSRVEHDGRVFEVVGVPLEARTRTKVHHVEVQLREVTG